jgi:hypothetical protein
MLQRFFHAFFALVQLLCAQAAPMVAGEDLRDFVELSQGPRELIESALKASTEVAGMPYKMGENGAAEGGFDCSVAMYHALRKVSLKPPRTSAD